jgi:hypothetical protein
MTRLFRWLDVPTAVVVILVTLGAIVAADYALSHMLDLGCCYDD